MNGTARVIVPATITDISDGPYFYAACQQCYSKLVESSDTFSCPKCRRKLSRDKVEFRYRLSMTITDFSTFATVTAFGGILNVYFGCSASEFSKRWITKLQGLVGSLEPPVTKWAIEESLVGCHLHFGFKIHPKALGIHKAEGKHGISLRDIGLQYDKSSVYPRTDSNLVAVQMITQNNCQLPAPAIFHLQCAMSSFDNVNVDSSKKGPSSTETEIQNFIQKKYSRNRQKISGQNLTSSLKFYAEDGSVLSSLDQTSIALGCSDSLMSSLLSDKLTMSQHPQACDFSGVQSKSRFDESSDSKKDDVHFVNTVPPQCIADAQIMSEDELRAENDYMNQSSVLLFESPESVLSHTKIQEVPRGGGDGDCSLVPCALNGNIDLSFIETGEISKISSDLFYLSSHLSESKDRSNASLPLCHFGNCESESLKTDGINHSLKEELIKNSELEKLNCSKFSYGKLCLKSLSWKSKSNERVHSKWEKSIDFLGVPAESYSQCMAESLRHSSSDHEAVTISTHLDMPESEDLELFLKAANNSTDQLKVKDVMYSYSPARILENNQIHHHQSICGKRAGIKDKERKPVASPHFNQWKRKLTPHINQQSRENTMSAHIDCGLASLRTSNGSDLKQQIRFHDERRHAQTSVASNIYESSKVRASDLALEDFHHEKGDFQGEFTAMEKLDKYFKNNLSVADSNKPFNLSDGSLCKVTKCDTDLISRPQGGYCSGDSSTEEVGEMNDSCDLFSSPEALDSVFVNTFKELSVEKKTSPSNINFNDDRPLAVNTRERLYNIDSDCYSVRKEYCNNVESHMIHHDESYDLFSTPGSKTYENMRENVSRSVSPGFQPDCNSFDLFSSSEDEL